MCLESGVPIEPVRTPQSQGMECREAWQQGGGEPSLPHCAQPRPVGQAQTVPIRADSMEFQQKFRGVSENHANTGLP